MTQPTFLNEIPKENEYWRIPFTHKKIGNTNENNYKECCLSK